MHRRTFLRSAVTGLVGSAGTLLHAPPARPFQMGPIVRYPYVQNVGASGASVLWTTREPGVGAVEYATDRTFSAGVTATVRTFLPGETGVAAYYQHQADLPALAAGTRYYYRVLLNGKTIQAGDGLRFRTSGPGAFSFLAFGDSGQGTPAQARVAEAMLAERPDFVLHTGDIAYPNGTFQEFQRVFFDYYPDLLARTPIFPCPGNHDYGTGESTPYLTMYALPGAGVAAADRGLYYSFDWGNAHFVSLDSNAPLVLADGGGGGMLDWLDRDLGGTRKFWRIVYFQHPPYATGPNEKTPESERARRLIVPILERHGVQVVFSGDEHGYQRTLPVRQGRVVAPDRGIVYFTTAGGGADLYVSNPNPLEAKSESIYHYMQVAVDGPRLVARAVRTDGSEIESVAVAPPPVIFRAGSSRLSSTAGPVRRGSIRIVGQQLASEEVLDSSGFPPSEVNGTVVHLDGRRLPLPYVSATEILALLRPTGRGEATLRVTTPNGWTETKITI